MTIQLNVSAPDASPEELEELAKRLADAGLEVQQTLAAIGTITGAVEDEATVAAIDSIAGPDVIVERSRDYQLPPPDAPTQ